MWSDVWIVNVRFFKLTRGVCLRIHTLPAHTPGTAKRAHTRTHFVANTHSPAPVSAQEAAIDCDSEAEVCGSVRWAGMRGIEPVMISAAMAAATWAPSPLLCFRPWATARR